MTDSRAARISVLASIVRVSHPEGILRHIALGIGTFFGMMGIATLALRTQLCIVNACLMTKTVLIAQTTSEYYTFVDSRVGVQPPTGEQRIVSGTYS